MTIHFFIKYHTSYGETLFISGNHAAIGEGDIAKAFPMTYYNDSFWQAELEFPSQSSKGEKLNKTISYR